MKRFYLGLAAALTLAVTVTPIGTQALERFSYHMIQHITTLMLVGPFLVLATSQEFRDRLNRNQIFVFLTSPWISFIAYAAMMVGVHLPPIHMFIMDKPWSHYLIELPLYLTVPYLFYFNLIEPKLTNRRVSTGKTITRSGWWWQIWVGLHLSISVSPKWCSSNDNFLLRIYYAD